MTGATCVQCGRPISWSPDQGAYVVEEAEAGVDPLDCAGVAHVPQAGRHRAERGAA